MTLFEIIIICIVAALFVATIFVFIVCISYIKQVHITNKPVVTLTNVAFECRSFLEKLSKHDVIVKINNISGLEKKVGEVIGICKNQTNNISFVKESLDGSLDDIKKRNNLIADNHKLLENINSKIVKIQNNTNIIEEFSDSITYIKEKVGETSVDSEKEIIKINKQLEDILSWTKRCKSGVEALVEGHNKGIDATRKAFEVINDTLSNISDNIDNVIKNNKINNDEIAKISSILDQYREKVNYITKLIENATKLKTATKTKMVQSKIVRTPAK